MMIKNVGHGKRKRTCRIKVIITTQICQVAALRSLR